MMSFLWGERDGNHTKHHKQDFILWQYPDTLKKHRDRLEHFFQRPLPDQLQEDNPVFSIPPLFSAKLKPPPSPHIELTPSSYLLDTVSAHAGRTNAVGTEEVAVLYLQSTRAPQTFCGLGSTQLQYSQFREKARDVITLPAEGPAFNL